MLRPAPEPPLTAPLLPVMESQRTLRADALLLLTAALWGFAFVAQKAGMKHVEPFTFNAVRFALGVGVVLAFLCRRPVRPAGGAVIAPGILAGVALFCGASLQQIGIVSTTAGKAGFITGLYVLFVPLIGLLWGNLPVRRTWLGVALAVIGMYLLSVSGGLDIGRGDLLVTLSAVFFAVHVLLIGWRAPRSDPLRLAVTQFATVSLLSLIAALRWETITLAGLRGAALPIFYGGVLSVGVAYTLQVVAQREASATHAAIIMSLEAVFAALGGWVLLGESMKMRALAGCGLMIGGMILSQLDSSVRRPPSDRRQQRS